jgi:serine protease Do
MASSFISSRWLATASVAAALAATGLFGLRAAQAGHENNPPATLKEAPRSAARHGYAAVVKRVVPAVVNISSSKVVKPETSTRRGRAPQGRGEIPQGIDPFFRQFFGDDLFQQFNVPQERREHSLGSGVIISPEGYLLTNNHVVDGANDVTVTLYDKREMKARVVGTDSRTDIAVLKIEGSNFPYLTLADSSKVEVGDIVLAIGDPFGVGQTVTSGIVSATGRSLGGQIEEVEDFIQTDAPINPGNSGGALVDEDGYLIGINTAIIAGNSGGNQGIGFAVPINMARHDMDQILKSGKVERGYLGIVPQDVTPTMARALRTAKATGALVGDVTESSPAARGGLETRDIILDVDGQAIADANQLRLKIGLMNPNETVKLKVLHNGQPKELAVKLGEFPDKAERASVGGGDRQNSGLEGVEVETLTSDTAKQLQLPVQTKGVVVNTVSAASRAAEAGLQRGDVILEVNHQSVKSTGDFRQAVSASSKNDPVLLLVNREGRTLFLAV